MRYDPPAPDWPDRDRFVLSAGHASILLYSMLHLTGYDLTLDDLRAFRQWGSRTPGHPERTTPPASRSPPGRSGQGFANAVGMAIAERCAAGPLRRRASCDHHTFVDLRRRRPRGGHQPRGRLAGRPPRPRPARLRLRRQPHHHRRPHRAGPHRRRRRALRGLRLARRGARRGRQRPRRARGARSRRAMAVDGPPVADRPAQPHRLPLAQRHRHRRRPRLRRSTPTRSAATKACMGLPPTRPSTCPTTCSAIYREAGARGRGAARRPGSSGSRRRPATDDAYDACLGRHRAARAGRTRSRPGSPARRWPPAWRAGRSSRPSLDVVPGLVGGGADLTGNTGTELKDEASSPPTTPGGRQIHFGIREHGMARGHERHGAARRRAAGRRHVLRLQRLHAPGRPPRRHQPGPGHLLLDPRLGRRRRGRPHPPADRAPGRRCGPCPACGSSARPTPTRPRQAWRVAVDARRPDRADPQPPGPAGPRGHRRQRRRRPGRLRPRARTGRRSEPDVVLVGTGSEVHVCVDAADAAGRRRASTVRVVSMPCWELFAEQADGLPAIACCPPRCPTLAVEAGVSFGWDRWADDIVGIDRFGASAPGGDGRWPSSASPPSTWPSGPAQLLDDLAPTRPTPTCVPRLPRERDR